MEKDAEVFARTNNENVAKKFRVSLTQLHAQYETGGTVPDRAGSFNERLKAVFARIESLPTVMRGKEALGLQFAKDCSTHKIQDIASPYTSARQRPYIFIPGVPARTFYNPTEFEFTRTLEDAFPIIRKELTHLLNDSTSGFKMYKDEAGLIHTDWNTFNFFANGTKVEANCERCPETTRIVESLPRVDRTLIMFSAINAGTHIPPHVGPLNGILRGHLGLICSPGCVMRVGGDEQGWQEGKVMVFDDSFVHSAWNNSDSVRVVLFLNFWHPCFSAEEVAVMRLFLADVQKHDRVWEVWEMAQAEPRPVNIRQR